MKKFLVVLAAGLLVAGLCGQANAFFYYGTSQTDLIRVVYESSANGGVYEEATDLGTVASVEQGSFTNNAYDLTQGAGGVYNLAGASASNLNVAYFASNGSLPTNATEYWTSGSATGTQTNNGGAHFTGPTWQGTNSVLKYYTNTTQGAGTANVWAAISAPYSFYKSLNGTYSGYLLQGSGSAALTNGSATQGLYDWSPAGTSQTIGPEYQIVTSYQLNPQTGDYIVSTQVTPLASPTPIPPSVLLLGSGLLGLIGIKRRELFGH